mmetsp:Transcript_99379/g.290069  ORF Transcript_99379/g.290069 Transcript_99379/m.290069 type:complete len:1088 (+) Transcript_99379:52-3315(+)
MSRAAVGTRQRKSVTPNAVSLPLATNSEGEADSRPVTRSRTTAARAAHEAADGLAFLGAAKFEGTLHVPALYRLAASEHGSLGPAVRDKGVQGTGDPDIDGFPSAFSVIDLNDRRGVWQSDPPLVKALGEDPSKQFRDCGAKGQRSPRMPAGLKNLGATCYLNSLLQYLFFNADFRQNLLRMECDSIVVRALQRVFALLASGDRCTVDPSEFVTAASIDALEQADATEFSALLLDWLQREMSQSQEPNSGNFVSSLFEGEVSQVLACTEDPTHTFERRENFYELRARLTPAVAGSRAGSSDQAESKEAAPVAKSKTGRKATNAKAKSAPLPPVRLEHLLQETAFPDEVLNGSNQYHCARCNKKVDARKTTRLARLPPYLHVTIERYHYDLAKGERRKLNRSVSFPRRLELRLRAPPLPPGAEAPPQVETAIPVVYECVGYLEHVSDSAHSGHYTATLLQEETSAFEDLYCSASTGRDDSSEAAAVNSRVPSSDNPPWKRQRCDNADAAAGLPRRGTWWTLDDATVTAVNWAGGTKDASGSSKGVEGGSAHPGACCAPDRIETAAAYLVLYRRSDHVPGNTSQPGTLSIPAPLAGYVAEANSSFALEREKYAKRSGIVDAFLEERRRAVNSLVQALQQAAKSQMTSDPKSSVGSAFSFVPSTWLNDFLHGEDRQLEELELLDGDTSLAPVLYGQSLLRAKGCFQHQIIDPLAVWSGEVKLVPTAALDALCGSGGLDGSLFLQAEEAMGPEACKAVWHLFQAWCQEQHHIAQILKDGKLTTTEARQLEAQGRGSEAVWIATRVHNVWRKVTRVVGCRTASQLRADWRSFVAEAHRARWGGSSSSTASGVTHEESDPNSGSGEVREAEGSPAKQTAAASEGCSSPTATGPEVNLLAGLTCIHGLMNRPRAAFLVRRADVVRLLETSSTKERLYTELWPGARSVPKFCSGLLGGQLLSFGDVCTECRGDSGAARTTNEDAVGVQLRTFTVRRRFSSGCNRKQGTISAPVTSEAGTVTCREVKAACREKLGWPVARLLVLGQDGEDMELANDDLVGDSVSIVIVEKDESATPAEREGAAFEGSVFRMAPTQA